MKKMVCALVIGLIIPAFAGAAIHNLQVSNNTSAAVTISWITDADDKGEVHYSESSDLSNALTADDVRGAAFEGCTHYVDIASLKKETLYYFEVVSGGEVDNNSGNYYSFKTMKEPFAPPGICLYYGYVYQEDGSTTATGAIVYLWVTHNGEESYPLSKLIDRKGEEDATFVFNIKETRGVDTDNLFSSIHTGDPIHLEAVYCGDYTTYSDMVFEGCTYNCGSMILLYNLSGTTTLTTTPTTAPTTTPTTAPTTTPTTAPTTTPTTAPTTTPTTAPTTTPTTAPTTTPTTAPTTTTTILSTTTSETPPPQCEVIINLPSVYVSPWENMQLSARTFCDGKAVTGNYVWYVDTSAGSKIDENGLYRAGAITGTDTVTVIDTLLNENNVATGTITISPLWPMAYDKMWGAKKGKNLSLLRKFRDDVLADSEMGQDYIFMLYNNSLEILILLLQNPPLMKETSRVIDGLFPGIHSLLDGGGMKLSRKQLADVESLLAKFETKASPWLKTAIKKVRKDLREGELFSQFRKTGIKRIELDRRRIR